MLTVRYRFNERFRPIEADPQFLTLRKEEPPPSPPVVHVEPEPVVETTDEEAEDELLREQIRQLEYVSKVFSFFIFVSFVCHPGREIELCVERIFSSLDIYDEHKRLKCWKHSLILTMNETSLTYLTDSIRANPLDEAPVIVLGFSR